MQTQYTYKKPQPSAEGAYADDLSVLAYRKVLASMQEQRTVLKLNSMKGQCSSRKRAIKNIDELISSLETTLKNECCHNYIVNDYIDIGPERSMPINYCDRCYQTFSNK